MSILNELLELREQKQNEQLNAEYVKMYGEDEEIYQAFTNLNKNIKNFDPMISMSKALLKIK